MDTQLDEQYEVRLTSEGKVLFKNGIMQSCPFRPAIAVPQSSGLSQPGKMNISLVEKPCGEWCPHFRLIPGPLVQKLKITCGELIDVNIKGNAFEPDSPGNHLGK